MKEFKLDEEAGNPAFINDFIEICWVDPWAADPAKPKLRGYKSQQKKQLKDWEKKSKKVIEKGMSFIDELHEQPVKEITIF